MKIPDREFPASDAVRKAVPLWLCAFGASGSGKTWTALELATGVQQVMGGDIYGLDTEGNRMLAYADYFKFKHVPFVPPFGSLDYLAAVQSIYKRGGRIIIGDSWSHEHEGVGGLIDYQEKEVQRMAGDDWQKQERVKMLAWSKPKAARRQLLNGMTSLPDVTFILCFRAADVSKPIKGKDNKTEVVHMGFTPIGAREFVYEATAALYLPPASKGKPDWNPENPGERMMAKLPRQFEGLFQNGEQVTREHGRKMAEWARGATVERKSNGDKSAADRAREFMKFLDASTTVKGLDSRWNHKDSQALLAHLDDDTRRTCEAKYGDLRDSLAEREAM